MKFIKTEQFLKKGNDFNILIIHDYNDYLFEHGWCLYVRIFKNHPLFEKASKNDCDYDMDLGNEIYPHWHCGCTYYNKQSTYIQIGCDYKHIGDEELWHESEIPAQVDLDAEELYDFFEKAAEGGNK